MNDLDMTEYCQRIDAYTKKLTKQQCLDLLVSAGIATPKGNLTKPYR